MVQWIPDNNRCSHRPRYKMIPFGDTYSHHPLPPNPLHNTSSHAPNMWCCLHVFCRWRRPGPLLGGIQPLSLSIPMWCEYNGSLPPSSISITRSARCPCAGSAVQLCAAIAQPMVTAQCRRWTVISMSSIKRDGIQRSHVHFMLESGRWLSNPMLSSSELGG